MPFGRAGQHNFRKCFTSPARQFYPVALPGHPLDRLELMT